MLAFFLAGTEAFGLQVGTEMQGGCKESKDPWPECAKPTKKFEHIMNTQPGKQWPEAGGYCGAWSTQRAAMEKGAWISQQQVRDHTTGKTQHEIATLNIDLAWENLKLKYEAFDFRNEPVPQLDAIRTFVKKQLAAGHVVVMQKVGNHFPIARRFTLQEGSFSHIVPFVGLMSDHPLTDEQWYDDDYIVHYHDHDVNDVNYRSMKSLVGSYDNATGSGCPSQPDTSDSGYICLNPSFGYGWALTGFNDTKVGLPLSLTVDPSDKEPDRSGCDGRGTTCEDPIPLTGTLHINGLAAGQKYAIYRWDDVESAFDYTRPAAVHRFTASGPSLNYTDTTTIISNGTTYYRCVDDS